MLVGVVYDMASPMILQGRGVSQTVVWWGGGGKGTTRMLLVLGAPHDILLRETNFNLSRCERKRAYVKVVMGIPWNSGAARALRVHSNVPYPKQTHPHPLEHPKKQPPMFMVHR